MVLPKKEDVLSIYRDAKMFVHEKLGLTFHPDKVYIQHIAKGVKFVGSVIKPNRVYLSNRTIGSMYEMLASMERHCKRLATNSKPTEEMMAEVEHDICSCNSYMGFLIHHNTYAIRRKMFVRMKWFWRVSVMDGHYSKVVIKNKYKMFN